jgi:hypothetical protein
MKVKIGAEAALFPAKEYINGIAVAVWYRNEIILSVILEGGGGGIGGETWTNLVNLAISGNLATRSTFIGYLSSPNGGTESTFMYRAKEDFGIITEFCQICLQAISI